MQMEKGSSLTRNYIYIFPRFEDVDTVAVVDFDQAKEAELEYI